MVTKREKGERDMRITWRDTPCPYDSGGCNSIINAQYI